MLQVGALWYVQLVSPVAPKDAHLSSQDTRYRSPRLNNTYRLSLSDR
jgi:hypothetical protein